jgi:CBS domain containing-hemolysin-like protein
VEDEFSKTGPVWQRRDDGSLSGAGSLSIFSLEEALGVLAPEVDANSVGGLVTETLGRIPDSGERVAFGQFEIEVLSMDGPRIDQVKVTPRITLDDGES